MLYPVCILSGLTYKLEPYCNITSPFHHCATFEGLVQAIQLKYVCMIED
ncbi:hypothetical protein ES332_D05G209000v1 [Gossypium tomentosum]|uniref:Uncharacterized protein n=1 Tax=Gossypium tomentosum TaxID=34277 RepID=A0A5D2KXG3_GOSTO|nr:hypothetical protein ES332_D05G209000v1 [Gossypium tomentosum]